MPELQERAEIAARRAAHEAHQAERWAEDAVGAIDEQIERPEFDFATDHPRLFTAELRFAVPDLPIPPTGVERLRVKLYARGWHWVELSHDGVARLGLARDPVVVRLSDGSEFTAVVQKEFDDTTWAERIVREGAWRYDLARPVLVSPSQIAAVIAGPRASAAPAGEEPYPERRGAAERRD